MAKYTIEDIEILRQKSGISYEEAVNLLEYHNGSLARALVDLEKNGRLKSSSTAQEKKKGVKGLIHTLYCLRVLVRKKDLVIVNLSSLFVLLVALSAPHVCIVGVILALVLGYEVRLVRNSSDFQQDQLDDLVRNARENVQNTVQAFAQQLSAEKAEEPSQQRAENAPSGTRPVNVSFADGGSVNVRDGGDGYHEADIR